MEGYDYEVFLSFRGPDTRTGFTDYLYTRLTDVGVRTYRDEEELHVGEEIGPDLLKAIEQSKISIPIFSKRYPSSRWCLKELAQMVECRKRKGQIIMPIFYHVEPSELRNQTGGYGEAFLVHQNEKRVDDETIRKWRAALNEVGGLKGWNVENVANSYEGQLVKQVVTSILSELKKMYLRVNDILVGVEDHVKEVMGMIGTGTDDAKIVGIYGMSGIGKTTLAKVVYNKLLPNFDNCCFLDNVREASHPEGIKLLQTRLISNLSKQEQSSTINCVDEGIWMIEDRFSSKKVLILLDDVDEKSQLTALLGRHGCFGPGSRILITTRNAIVLREFGVELTYPVVGLDEENSLKLFSKYVFRRNHPPIEKMERSREIVKIAEGLPLLLVIMGSALSICGQREEMWDEYLVKWKKCPIERIRSKLMISYEALDDTQKQIFLDIACLFNGYDMSKVIYMWSECGLCPMVGLEVLQLMSLIKIGEDGKLWMHDLLKDLGRDIIFQESGGEIYKQSRLWEHKDALEMLLQKKGNGNLKALCLMHGDWLKSPVIFEGFAALPNLRFLRVDGGIFSNRNDHILPYNCGPIEGCLHSSRRCRALWKPIRIIRSLIKILMDSQAELLWHIKCLIMLRTNFSLSKNQLLPNLRWLSWHGFPQQILLSNFSLRNLVILDFSNSRITHDWEGWRHIKRAEKLKVLDLSQCDYLIKTPDLSGFLSLERLILEECYKLTEVDSSIGQLKRLVFLNLSYCEHLHYLPMELGGLPYLTELLLDWSDIREIPNWSGMEKLESPHVQISTSTKTGDSLDYLPSLLTLSLERASITHLPDSIVVLTNLKNLSLCHCIDLHELPDSIGALTKLENLSLRECFFMHKLPDSIGALTNLENLSLNLCTRVHKLPYSIKELQSLIKLDLFDTNFIELPDSMENLENLKALNLCLSKKLVASALPKLPKSLTSLGIVARRPIIDPDLSYLINLKELSFIAKVPMISGPSESVHVPLFWWLGRLSKLEVLTLGHPSITDLFFELGALPHLKTLRLSVCFALECILQIPSSVTKLLINRCSALYTLDISYLKDLSELSVFDSPPLSRIERPDNLLGCNIRELRWIPAGMIKEQHGLKNIRFCSGDSGRGLFSKDSSSSFSSDCQQAVTPHHRTALVVVAGPQVK